MIQRWSKMMVWILHQGMDIQITGHGHPPIRDENSHCKESLIFVTCGPLPLIQKQYGECGSFCWPRSFYNPWCGKGHEKPDLAWPKNLRDIIDASFHNGKNILEKYVLFGFPVGCLETSHVYHVQFHFLAIDNCGIATPLRSPISWWNEVDQSTSSWSWAHFFWAGWHSIVPSGELT